MRIAQIAPLAESVPPKLYGGTERVVAWLVDELVDLGHQVTLFEAARTLGGRARRVEAGVTGAKQNACLSQFGSTTRPLHSKVAPCTTKGVAPLSGRKDPSACRRVSF